MNSIKPDSIQSEESPSKLLLTRDWSMQKGFIIISVIILFLVVAANLGLVSYFPLGWVAVASTTLTYGIMHFFNKTCVRVTRESIVVMHQPLQLFRRRHINTRMISQLYVNEKIRRSTDGKTATYSVQYVDKDGESKTLLRGLQSVNEAVYIEKAIEKWLGIEDDFHFETNQT